jgi:hypothetical protein
MEDDLLNYPARVFNSSMVMLRIPAGCILFRGAESLGARFRLGCEDGFVIEAIGSVFKISEEIE